MINRSVLRNKYTNKEELTEFYAVNIFSKDFKFQLSLSPQFKTTWILGWDVNTDMNM